MNPICICFGQRVRVLFHMSAHQVRRSLAFARRTGTKVDLGWWGLTVYNWCRPHRALRLDQAESDGKKISGLGPRPWLGLTNRLWFIRNGLLTPVYPAGSAR